MSFLLGQRGVGKTTVVIQHLLDYVDNDIFSQKILPLFNDYLQSGYYPYVDELNPNVIIATLSRQLGWSHFLELLFFHRAMKSLVVIELKLGKFKAVYSYRKGSIA